MLTAPWPDISVPLSAPFAARPATGFARCMPRMPSVRAGLGYLAPGVERPYNFMYEPPGGQPRDNCTYELHDADIVDARVLQQGTSVHREGFELWDAPTQVTDFDDESQIAGRCYPEAVELACAVTGARWGHVFDHVVRRREPGRPALSFGRHGDGTRPSAVGRVHNDYTEMSGRRRLRLVLDEAQAARVDRYSIVNIWRSIKAPVLDTPLAVCDARTVRADELVASEVRYPTRTGEIYLSLHAPRHRWYYYPAMDRHEALVFKQYDALASGVARFTPHAAFDHPDMPPDAPLRESIEIRCLVVYD